MGQQLRRPDPTLPPDHRPQQGPGGEQPLDEQLAPPLPDQLHRPAGTFPVIPGVHHILRRYRGAQLL